MLSDPPPTAAAPARAESPAGLEAVAAAGLDFELPPELEADRPPEARGRGRDGVRLMVSTRADAAGEHARFTDLPALLAPGDLLVVNTSATLPAALPGRHPRRGEVEVRLSTLVPQIEGPEWWIVELRSAGGTLPYAGGAAGDRVVIPAGGRVELVAPYRGSRLWVARIGVPGPLPAYLERHGAPIRYRHAAAPWPLDAYQTVFALEPGSAEMPSAARPFTADLVTRLVAAGVGVAPVTLHAGVSSPERGEGPFPERYAVPAPTAARVNSAREAGGRVIAVGTTVVRALETAVGPGWRVRAAAGWTEHVVGPASGVRSIDGLITGWHEPRASHLELLAAVAGPELLERSYRLALAEGYLWHELGDSHLILPAPRARAMSPGAATRPTRQ